MSDLVKRTIDMNGYHLVLEADEEPTIEDEELARKLGHQRTAKLRELTRSLIKEGFINDSEVIPSEGKTSAKGGRPGLVYRYTEAGALKVIARSETKVAHKILGQVIDVYIAVRRQLLEPPPPAKVEAVPTYCACVGDNPDIAKQMKAWCRYAAKSSGVSTMKVHGWLRRMFKSISVYKIPLLLWDHVRDQLCMMSENRLLASKQQELFTSTVTAPQLPRPGISNVRELPNGSFKVGT
jgi:predicted transcriptional regulator